MKSTHNEIKLPVILCGPIIRRLQPDQIVLWWISPREVSGEFECFDSDNLNLIACHKIDKSSLHLIKIGNLAYAHLLTVPFEPDLPVEKKIYYSLRLEKNGKLTDICKDLPFLLYPGQWKLSFTIKMNINVLLHGSCRKPHYESEDAFIGAEKFIQETLDNTDQKPALLMLTGDQIYADDVAGPMLHAIHQVIKLLGLLPETQHQFLELSLLRRYKVFLRFLDILWL